MTTIGQPEIKHGCPPGTSDRYRSYLPYAYRSHGKWRFHGIEVIFCPACGAELEKEFEEVVPQWIIDQSRLRR